jgi:probable addiction module antidote protein
MQLKDYRNDLLRKLANPEFAAEYLSQTLAENDPAAFLIALRDVVEASSGTRSMSRRLKTRRASLHRVLSADGNPTVSTVQQVLEPLGLRMAVGLAKAA